MDRNKTQAVQPNSWYHQELWRQVFLPEDEEKARRARRALADVGLYPTGILDPGTVSEANHRAALHDIVDELDPTDLRAVLDLARLLVLIPRDPQLFEGIERKATYIVAMAMIANGEDPHKIYSDAELAKAGMVIPKSEESCI